MATKAELIERHEQLLKLDEQLTDHQKTAHFDMKTQIAKQTPCGTVCCLLGFAGLQPWFIERGCVTDVGNPGAVMQLDDWDDFFGRNCEDEMFAANLSSSWTEAMQRVRDRLEAIKVAPEGTY